MKIYTWLGHSHRHQAVRHLDFTMVYQWLGYDRYDNAVRQLKNLFMEDELALDNHW